MTIAQPLPVITSYRDTSLPDDDPEVNLWAIHVHRAGPARWVVRWTAFYLHDTARFSLTQRHHDLATALRLAQQALPAVDIKRLTRSWPQGTSFHG